jgi:hypothetical protein
MYVGNRRIDLTDTLALHRARGIDDHHYVQLLLGDAVGIKCR